MSNETYKKTGLMVIIMLSMISLAYAITVTTITNVDGNSHWRKMDSDLALTHESGGQDCIYMSSDAVKRTIICSGGGKSDEDFVSTCTQPYNNKDDCWAITGGAISKMDYSTGVVTTDSHPWLADYQHAKLIAYIPGQYVMTYVNGTSANWLVSTDLTGDNTSSYTLPSQKPSITQYEYYRDNTSDTNRFNPPFLTYDADHGWIIWDAWYEDLTDTVYLDAYYQNGSTEWLYSQVASRTGVCYNINNASDYRNFDDEDFPSHFFAAYDDQSEVLTIKPSCHYYWQLDLADFDNISSIEYPSNYQRDTHLLFSPLMYLPTGLFEGTFLEFNASAEELFMNNSDGGLMYFDNDPTTLWVNEQAIIYPYMNPTDNYGGAVGENVFRTVILNGGSIIYPTSNSTHAIATDLYEGVALTLEGEINLTKQGEDITAITYTNTDRTYAFIENGTHIRIARVDTNQDDNLFVDMNKTIIDTGYLQYAASAGRYSGFPSIDNERLLFGMSGDNRNWWDLRDGDLTNISDELNYTSANVVDSYVTQITDSSAQINYVAEYSGSTSRICQWRDSDNDDYPYDEGTTCYVSGFNGFRALQIAYAANGGWILVYGGEFGTGGSDRGVMMCRDSGGSITCDQAGALNLTKNLASGINLLDTDQSGEAGIVINTTTFAYINYSLDLAGGAWDNVVLCEDPLDVGATITAVDYVDKTGEDYVVAGTSDGRLLICDFANDQNKSTNTMSFGLGTIGSTGQSIVSMSNEQFAWGNGDNLIHAASKDYYMTVNVGLGGGSANVSYCGDLSCDAGEGENAQNCPADCPATCGDGYCTHNETTASCPADCPAGGPPDNATNQTILYPETVITNPISTDVDMRTLKVVNNTAFLVAGEFEGSDEVRKYHMTTENFLYVDGEDLIDTAYTVDSNDETVFVGTNDEIHVFIGLSTTMSLYSRDKWTGLFHYDRAQDYAAIDNNTGYVCDNHDEPDYHTAGQNNPVGNLGGGCYDLEYDGSGDILYVDLDDNGVNIINASIPTILSIINSVDYRSVSHGLDAGDLLDLRGEALVAKRNLYSFSVINVSNPSTPSLITHCNNGGSGEIISVESYNDEYAIAGTNDGRISICQLNETNETQNTDTYTVENMTGELIRSVEARPDGLVIVMGNESIAIVNLSLQTFTNNTPPTLDNYTVSDTTPQVGQPVDVQIIAANIEPEDVIRYGIKCLGTEASFTENTNGMFTCTYTEAGTYNLRMAVTDNFHLGTWYDQTVETITVSPEEFEGGTLRITVIDEASIAIENATVTADNQSANTTEYGSVTITTATDGLYEVTTEKTGYYTDVSNYYADGTTHIVTLTSIPSENQSALQVTVVDQNGDPVEDALVSYTNTITYDYDWKWSNALGLAIFTDLGAGSVIVQASKEDYETVSTTANVVANTTTEVTLTMTSTYLGEGVIRIDRDCIDDGIWLCGDVDVECTLDSQCLSNHCNNVTSRCTKFNYSVCDANSYPRGQSCVYKFTFDSYMGKITNWMLTNLLWLLVILVILFMIGFALAYMRR